MDKLWDQRTLMAGIAGVSIVSTLFSGPKYFTAHVTGLWIGFWLGLAFSGQSDVIPSETGPRVISEWAGGPRVISEWAGGASGGVIFKI